MGNKTAIVIRVRIEVIKGWKEAKEGGSEKEEEKGTERRKISIRERERERVKVTPRERESYLL